MRIGKGILLWVAVGFLSLTSLVMAEKKDNGFINLPGASSNKPTQQRVVRQVGKQAASYHAKSMHGPPKEWQSFRSTSEITCGVLDGDFLWAGTKSSGLVRWNLKNNQYRFYVPRGNNPRDRKIRALTVGNDGSLWIGTHNGLAQIPKGKKRWTFFRGKDGIKHSIVQAIFIRKNGTIWVGTPGGVAYRKVGGKKWWWFHSENGLPTNEIQSIGEDTQGRIWFSSSLSVPFYLKNKKFVKMKKFPVVGSSCIVPDAKGGVWFCSNLGALYYKNGKTKVFDVRHGLVGMSVKTIALDSRGGVWMGTGGRGISYYLEGFWKSMKGRRGLPGLDVRKILLDKFGKIYAFTHLNGIARYTRKKRRWKQMRLGIVGNKIQALAQAPDGAIWVGTSSGVSRYYRGYWYNFTSELPNPDVRCFTFDPAGGVWIGTYGGGVARYYRNRWRKYDLLDGLKSNKVIAAATTPDGIWFVHPLRGVSRFNGTWHSHSSENNPSFLPLKYTLSSIHIDQKLRVWIASNGGGAALYQGSGKWKKVRKMLSHRRNTINAMTSDSKNNLWFATHNGLYRYRKGRLKHFTTREGLPDNNVVSIAAEGDKIWIGTKKGVACYDGMSWRIFTPDMGLISEDVRVVAVTPWGEKWFGTAAEGVSVYRGE